MERPSCCDGILERDEDGEWWTCSPDCEESVRSWAGIARALGVTDRILGHARDHVLWAHLRSRCPVEDLLELAVWSAVRRVAPLLSDQRRIVTEICDAAWLSILVKAKAGEPLHLIVERRTRTDVRWILGELVVDAPPDRYVGSRRAVVDVAGLARALGVR